MIGQPIARAWTRSWWVRPVRGANLTRLHPGHERTTRQRVRASRPPEGVPRNLWRFAGSRSRARSMAPSGLRRPPLDQGVVDLARRAQPELVGQRLVDGGAPRHDDHARGVLVEAMNDAGPEGLPADETAVAVEQPRNQGAPEVPAARVHNDALLLVHDDHVAVLVDDVQVHRLGLEGRLLGQLVGDLQQVARAHAAAELGGPAIDRDAHRARLELAACEQVEVIHDVAIEAAVLGGVVVDGDPKGFHPRRLRRRPMR